jgi:hypothetical protein
MDSKMSPVAVDIETEGFTIYDSVTVVGFELPMGSWIALNVDGQTVDADQLSEQLIARTGQHARVQVLQTEAELLKEVSNFVGERIAGRDDIYLTGFNAERWGGGFDIPFLRQSYGMYDINWTFRCAYIDVSPPIKDRVNTTVSYTDDEKDEANDLVRTYDVLINGSDGEYDPFDDSLEAVEAWEDGNWVDLLSHNQSDIRRTLALMKYAERYVPRSDLKMKNLAPVG